ncbi:MAG TPA: hypothetical protein VHA54_12740 [Solirubrobacterales bacterium]|nr:hypothetical protein [Solirubrobacterales bacterium]
MEPASPARLYVAAAGLILFAGGLAGFFADLSWLNFLHLASGAVALLLAGAAARPLALLIGLLYTGLALWGFSDGGAAGMAWAHLALGLCGLAAYAGGSEPRAQAAAERP